MGSRLAACVALGYVGSGGKSGPRFRLTRRDLELLRWLARAEHVGLRFGLARSKSYARLQALSVAGLVCQERQVPGQAVFYATRQGLALSGLALGEARVSLATLSHDLAVANVCALGRGGRRGPRRSDRGELRAVLRDEGDCGWRVWVRDSGEGRSGWHWPDLICHRGLGGFVAVEVELTQKRADRTRAILEGYRSHSEALAAVVYLTPDRCSVERIERRAEQAGFSSGTTVFCAAALSEPPDFAALFEGIRRAWYARRAKAAELEQWAQEREATERRELTASTQRTRRGRSTRHVSARSAGCRAASGGRCSARSA